MWGLNRSPPIVRRRTLKLIEGFDEVSDALKLAVNGGKPDIGDFAEGLQPRQYYLADFLTGYFPMTIVL